MTSPRKQSRFCGIDVGKNKHVACVIDRDGNMVVRSQSFTNDAEGYQCILDRLKEVGGPAQVADDDRAPAVLYNVLQRGQEHADPAVIGDVLALIQRDVEVRPHQDPPPLQIQLANRFLRHGSARRLAVAHHSRGPSRRTGRTFCDTGFKPVPQS